MNTQIMHNTTDNTELVQKFEHQKNTEVSAFSIDYYNPDAIVPDPNLLITLLKKEGRELTGARELELWAIESRIFSDFEQQEVRTIINNAVNDYYEYLDVRKSEDKSQSVIMSEIESRIASFSNLENMPQILKLANNTVSNIYSQLFPNSQQATLDMQRIIKFGVLLANSK
jgi:hypothetical protein